VRVSREWSGSAASITSHLGKTDVVLLSVSESSNPGHNRLFCCCGAEDVEYFVFVVVMRIFNSLAPHRHGVPTRGERAQVPGTLPWWVRDCDSKVTGKVSVGHAELRSSIAT